MYHSGKAEKSAGTVFERGSVGVGLPGGVFVNILSKYSATDV